MTNWLPTPLFTPAQRASLVKTHGEEWVRGEEEFMGQTKAVMDLIEGKKSDQSPTK
jgi:hypothetical protein